MGEACGDEFSAMEGERLHDVGLDGVGDGAVADAQPAVLVRAHRVDVARVRDHGGVLLAAADHFDLHVE